jgi:hypothetical protein
MAKARGINKQKAAEFVGTKKQKLTAVRYLCRDGKDQTWLFKCECGGTIKKRKQNFLNSNFNNCGCFHGKTKHSFSVRDAKGAREGVYISWVNMRQRINNPNKPDYPYYGGRGIKYSDRWESFENFYEDMGAAYFRHKKRNTSTTLDRVDVNGDYSPENCVWANRKRQSNNRNFVHQITFKSQTRTISEWADHIGVSRKVLYDRIARRHWSVERALTQRVRGS